jgi:putative metallo-beta-lactamase domain protein
MNADAKIKPEGSAKGPGIGILNGQEILMLANQSDSQMMSYIITTKNKELIVVDGGLDLDAEHLRQAIIARGGKVSAWFITHPHSDHVGALVKLINDGLQEISIDAVYYNFVDDDWYKRNEAYRADMVLKAKEALAKLGAEKLHGNIKTGDLIQVDDVKIHVLNDPYLFAVNSINNSSVALRMEIGSKRVLFLGDMGPEAGAALLKDVGAEGLKADIVQMAHHGQYGVEKNVYEAIRPSICMWNSPAWLYDNDNGGGIGSGKWFTLQVRSWMDELGVTKHFVIKDGDQLIK